MGKSSYYSYKARLHAAPVLICWSLLQLASASPKALSQIKPHFDLQLQLHQNDNIASSLPKNIDTILFEQHIYNMRGGAVSKESRGTYVKNALIANKQNADMSKSAQGGKRIVLGSITGVALSWLIWENRVPIAKVLDKKRLQDATLKLLEKIEKEGNQGVIVYILGMAMWEMCGLATLPVETAAGMAFGFRKGTIASGLGKMLGALIAFLLGRYVMMDWVQLKLKDNYVMQLVDGSAEANPLKVAFLMRFSCFPEFIKNFGLSILTPVTTTMFAVATMFHGWIFTALWTYLGADTVRHLQDKSLPANRVLQVLLVAAAVNGIVVSPAIMAWWVRDLKQQSLKLTGEKGKRK